MFSVLASFILCFFYRLRGGGWFTLPGTQIARLVWGISFGLACFCLDQTQWIISIEYVLTSFLALALIPHGYCQNMGEWPTPQNKWPSFAMPKYTQDQWNNLTNAEKTLNDFFQMGFVALWRGLIVFAISSGVAVLFYSNVNWANTMLAIATISVLQPVAYLIGFNTNLTIGNSLSRGATWGEFFNGAAWGIALVIKLFM